MFWVISSATAFSTNMNYASPEPEEKFVHALFAFIHSFTQIEEKKFSDLTWEVDLRLFTLSSYASNGWQP